MMKFVTVDLFTNRWIIQLSR